MKGRAKRPAPTQSRKKGNTMVDTHDQRLIEHSRALGGASPRHEYLLPVAEESVASSLYAPDLVIVSTGLVARRERRQELDTARPFDIALIDEAHYARRKNPTQGSRAQPQY